MNLNYFIHVLTTLLTKSGEDDSSLNQNIKEAIKEVSFKVILGFISAITMLVALIYFGNYLLYWLEQFEYGLEMQVMILIFVILLSGIFLYYLFRSGFNYKKSKNNDSQYDISDFNPTQLTIYFLAGILEGIQIENDINKPKSILKNW